MILSFHEAWIKALKLLPKHTIFHKQDWFLGENYHVEFKVNTAGEAGTFLSHASERYFHERPYLHHHCYIYLTKKPEKFRPYNSAVSTLMRKRMVPVQTTSEELALYERQA